MARIIFNMGMPLEVAVLKRLETGIFSRFICLTPRAIAFTWRSLAFTTSSFTL
jgi:hypothetical protein